MKTGIYILLLLLTVTSCLDQVHKDMAETEQLLSEYDDNLMEWNPKLKVTELNFINRLTRRGYVNLSRVYKNSANSGEEVRDYLVRMECPFLFDQKNKTKLLERAKQWAKNLYLTVIPRSEIESITGISFEFTSLSEGEVVTIKKRFPVHDL